MKPGVLARFSREPGDDDRNVHGVLVRFDVEVLTSLTRDGGRLAWVTFRRGSLDGHLARMGDPTLIPLDVDHEVPVGRLLSLNTTDTTPAVLRIIGECFDTRGGDLALEGALDGRLRGFSVEVRILQYDDGGERDGWPVVVVTEAELVAAAMCPDPADPECVITRACDVAPEWRLREEAEERDAQLREMLKRQPRPQPFRERAWGRGFGF